MLRNTDFCTKECSVNLKTLGYNEYTFGYYSPSGDEVIRNQSTYRGAYAEDCSYSFNSLPDGCLGYDNIDAPTHYDAQRWLREVFNIDVEVSYIPSLKRFCFMVADDTSILFDGEEHDMLYNKYETALNEGVCWITKELIHRKENAESAVI